MLSGNLIKLPISPQAVGSIINRDYHQKKKKKSKVKLAFFSVWMFQIKQKRESINCESNDISMGVLSLKHCKFHFSGHETAGK